MERTIIKVTNDRKTGEVIAEEVIGSKVVPDDFDLPLLRVLYEALPEEIKRGKAG